MCSFSMAQWFVSQAIHNIHFDVEKYKEYDLRKLWVKFEPENKSRRQMHREIHVPTLFNLIYKKSMSIDA